METRLAGERRESFEAFYDRTFGRIVAASRAWVGSDAEDVAQEAFLVARDRWTEVAALDQPGAWVRHVALRMAARRLRRDRDRGRLEVATRPGPSPSDRDLDLAAAILALPDRHALAVRLHHLEDRIGIGGDIVPATGGTTYVPGVHPRLRPLS